MAETEKTSEEVGKKLSTKEERKEARRQFLEKLDGTRCKVAMTGLCGAGKSTLMNTLLLKRACLESRGAGAARKKAGPKFLPINLEPRVWPSLSWSTLPG